MNPINIMQCGTLDIPVELLSRLTADYASIVMSSTCSSSSSESSSLSSSSSSSPPPSSSPTPPPPQRYAVLSYEQVKRLDALMDLVVPIHGRGNFPTLEVKLKDLVQAVRAKLERDSVHVRDIRLNGGAACHVLNDTSSSSTSTVTADPTHNQQPSYNDLDLIFAVDLSTPRDYERVKTAVLECLLDFLPAGVSKQRISSCSLKEAYVHKMVKVAEGDRWSLISLGSGRGLKVELKFVDAMRRQFEFSVDSFQIHLDSLLVFYECAEMPMNDNFYPTVAGESVYGDFAESLRHLRGKLIATRNPEEIRGGGLLKYCNLLARGYRPLKTGEIKTLERYMCSRFFIDFGDLGAQQQKLELYLANHFYGEEHLVPNYLVILHQVVDESTVCLMGHERRQTLGLIEELACQSYFQEQQRLLQGNSCCNNNNCNGNGCCNHQQQHPNHHQHHQQHYDFHVVYGNNNGGFYYTPYMSTAPPAHHHYSCYSWMPCA